MYVFIFLFFKDKDISLSENKTAQPVKEINVLSSTASVFDLTSADVAGGAPSRDIFSMSLADNSNGAVENTPKGQLPEHLKIVGILIGHPSQIIIEDTFASKTYFIDENDPQAGIKIVSAAKDQIVINYQGQDIPVAVHKN